MEVRICDFSLAVALVHHFDIRACDAAGRRLVYAVIN